MCSSRPRAQPTPPPPPMTTQATVDEEQQRMRQRERRRSASMYGRQATMIAGGQAAPPSGMGKTLLGQ